MAVFAPRGNPPSKPNINADVQLPLMPNNFCVMFSNAAPTYCAKPNSVASEDITKKGKSDGTITSRHSVRPLFALFEHSSGNIIMPINASDTKTSGKNSRIRFLFFMFSILPIHSVIINCYKGKLMCRVLSNKCI